MEEKFRNLFLHETTYRRGSLPRGGMDPRRKPSFEKSYPDAPRTALPSPDAEGGPKIWRVIAQRRSVRRYRAEALTQEQLSQLLWACQGMTGKMEQFRLRAAPSAGALHPVETYLVVNAAEGLEPGLYHYRIGEHALERLSSGAMGKAIAHAALDQDFLAEAPCVFVWTAVFARSEWKYLERAYRYIYLDAGHLAQNLALAAQALGLSSCQIGAFYDEAANDLIGVDGQEESVIYMSPVGYPE